MAVTSGTFVIENGGNTGNIVSRILSRIILIGRDIAVTWLLCGSS